MKFNILQNNKVITSSRDQNDSKDSDMIVTPRTFIEYSDINEDADKRE